MIVTQRDFPILSQVYNDEGLFEYMYDAPWAGLIDNNYLDIMFFAEYGCKPVSKLVYKYVKNNSITIDNKKLISSLVLSRFNANWKHKFDLLKVEYNPIQNYDMTETENINRNDKQNEINSETKVLNSNIDDTRNKTEKLITDNTLNHNENSTGSETIDNKSTSEKTDKITSNLDKSLKHNVYAFDSIEESPSSLDIESSSTSTNDLLNDTSSYTQSNKLTQDVDSNDTANSTSNNTVNENNNLTKSDDEKININIDKTNEGQEIRKLQRSGNIGVTTSQQMISSEIELWAWNFISDIFKDTSDLLSLPFYLI